MKYFQFKMLKQQRGYLVIVAMLLIVIVGFFATVSTNIFFSSTTSGSRYVLATQALYLAESGLEHATHKILNPTTSERYTCAYIASNPITNTLGNGSYTVSAVVNGNNCNVTSVGRVPNTNPVAQRTLTATIIGPSAEFGIFAGNVDLGNILYAKWDANISTTQWTRLTYSPAYNASIEKFYLSSANSGWVIGTSSLSTIGYWNGNVISTSSLPITENFRDIYCTTNGTCHLVGDYNSNVPTFLRRDVNTGTWTRIFSSGGAKNNVLTIHCASDSDCWAGGNFGGASGSDNVLFQYNGSGWTAVNVNGVLTQAPYNSIFCNSSSECWAVGASNIFGHKNATAWSQATYSALNAVQYNSVTCTSASDCWAVGNAKTTVTTSNSIAHWTGGTFGSGGNWVKDTSLSNTTLYNLNSVACFGVGNCWAVGSTTLGAPAVLRLVGSTWSRFTSISPALPLLNTLNSISLVRNSNAGGVAYPITAWQEQY